MRKIIFFFIILSQTCLAQVNIKGNVRDSKTKQPLAFCVVGVKGSANGCICNEDGVFSINAYPTDTFIVSYIGYKSRQVLVSTVLTKPDIVLTANENVLSEVTVHAGDELLYSIFEKARKKLERSENTVSKVYFQLSTEKGGQPIEMIESYYNGNTNCQGVNDLQLKNGRIALAENSRKSFFLSLNTSKAISYLTLTTRHFFMPVIPFQLSKHSLKRQYKLRWLTDNYDAHLYQVEFIPRKNDHLAFKGEVWINSETFDLEKIHLSCDTAANYSFDPLFPEDTISNVCMQLTQSYTKNEESNRLNYLNFSYSFDYKDRRATTEKVNTTGLMYFYDYGKPFTLPYFTYDSRQTDYRKISFLPYNESFWKTNTGLLYTEKQKAIYNFIKQNGVLVNFSRNHNKLNFRYADNAITGIFEYNNAIWSDSARLSVSGQKLDRNAATTSSKTFIADMYKVSVKIYLDVNRSGDTLTHFSKTVFDVYESFYNLPQTAVTNTFLNIYFDICEIERQEMEKVLSAKQYTTEQTDSIYKAAVAAMNIKTAQYVKDVELGEKTPQLQKWNDYVNSRLHIDNIQLFQSAKK